MRREKREEGEKRKEKRGRREKKGEEGEREKLMENKITFSICGTEYTLRAEENPAYMQKVAMLVDRKMNEMMSGGLSRMDAAVLTALNMTDEMLKQRSNTENLRSQLKGYLDDANKARSELSDNKREMVRLQQQLQRLQKGVGQTGQKDAKEAEK